MYDVVIVGAGPVGLSLAIAAQKRKLTYVVLEKDVLVHSIYSGPVNGTFFSTARQLELGGIPFVSQGAKPTRQEICQYYRRVAEVFDLNIRYQSHVSQLNRKDGHFEIELKRERTLEARRVVLATGFYDRPNLLGISGESLPHVSHYYRDPHEFFQRQVVIVGGRNSAVEAALEIFRAGGQVTLVHRGADFSTGVKYWLKPDIENRISEGSIQAFFGAQVAQIDEQIVRIRNVRDEQLELPADAVLLLTGYHPDTRLMHAAGVHVDAESLVPEHNPETLESNVPGLYIAGSPIAGRDCNRIFIENGREHGEQVMRALAASLDASASPQQMPPV
jgi:thioredoxin reductase (NADPH)